MNKPNANEVDKYNYTSFKPEYYNFTDFKGAKAGEKAIDFDAYGLDGEK